jgi:hypothetical protein
VPLPESIPVRYTEEEAEYISVRPVVRQTFRLHELIDMVLGVTGKDLARIQQILRSGTLVFHFYRYWWQGFHASDEELAVVLAHFPDSDPSREFRAEECTVALLESGGHPPRYALELEHKAASRRRLFRSRSFWDCLLALGRAQPPAYQGYSYARRADLFERVLATGHLAALVAEAVRLAPRDLRPQLRYLPEMSRIVYVCPRKTI